MQEINSPQIVLTDPAQNITTILERKVEDSSNPVLYRVQKSPGNWQDVRATEFKAQVVKLAKGLMAAGIEPGDAVGIMSRTRFEWALVDFAIWYAGAISVPVYETSSAAQAGWALSHSGAKAVIVEKDSNAETIEKARNLENTDVDLSALEFMWVMDRGDLQTLEQDAVDITDEQVEARRASRTLDDIATIVYTSGTTGRPKGCPLSHGNFVRLSANTKLTIPEIANETNSTIIFLPLAHVLARLIQVLALDAGVVVGHSPNIKNLASDLDSFKPTMLLVVPRVFEKIFEGAVKKAEKGGKLNSTLFNRSIDVAIAWSKAKIAGNVPLKLEMQYRFYQKLVYSKLHNAMGGVVKFAVSGGGRLAPLLGHFYHAVGIQVVEGYGLTETTAPLAVGRIRDFAIGDVGTLIPGNSVRLAEDGELEVKGVGVISGYYNNPEEDQVAFTEDGWLRTGDFVRIDENNHLTIIGRKKEIIVTAGGKNVVPAPAEEHIRTSPLVSQAMLVGDEKPFISALVTLDPEVLPDELEHLELPRTLTPKEASTNPTVREAIQKFIDEANAFVSKAESIREFRITDKDFTEEEGHLTPSMKVRRPQVLQDFSSYIEDMYNRTRESMNERSEKFQAYRAERNEKYQAFKAESAEKLHEFGEKVQKYSSKNAKATDDAETPIEETLDVDGETWVAVTDEDAAAAGLLGESKQVEQVVTGLPASEPLDEDSADFTEQPSAQPDASEAPADITVVEPVGSEKPSRAEHEVIVGQTSPATASMSLVPEGEDYASQRTEGQGDWVQVESTPADSKDANSKK